MKPSDRNDMPDSHALKGLYTNPPRETYSGARHETYPGARHETYPGARHETYSDARHETYPGARPGTYPDALHRLYPGSAHEMFSGLPHGPSARRSPRPFTPAAAAVFFIGILAGTVWIGMMPDALKAQLNFLGQNRTDAGRGAAEMALFLSVFLRRELQAGFLWLIGMTAFSVPVLLLAALYCGFSCAALVSLMTVQAGLLGLPFYLASVLPQALFYLPAVALLFFWGLEPSKKTHLAGFLILSVLVALGAFAECFLNPLVLRLLEFVR